MKSTNFNIVHLYPAKRILASRMTAVVCDLWAQIAEHCLTHSTGLSYTHHLTTRATEQNCNSYYCSCEQTLSGCAKDVATYWQLAYRCSRMTAVVCDLWAQIAEHCLTHSTGLSYTHHLTTRATEQNCNSYYCSCEQTLSGCAKDVATYWQLAYRCSRVTTVVCDLWAQIAEHCLTHSTGLSYTHHLTTRATEQNCNSYYRSCEQSLSGCAKDVATYWQLATRNRAQSRLPHHNS